MARPLRIEFAGALYHVTSRGNAQAAIYLTDTDRYQFLSLLEDVCSRYNWRVLAYCLMDNHYHLVIETGDANLSKGMRQLNGVYTQKFNAAHKRVGHIFQGRYKAILIDKDSYLLAVVRYVILNPVRARMVKTVAQYQWTNYHAMIDKVEAPDYLAKYFVLKQFASTIEDAQIAFIRFIKDGHNDAIWQNLTRQIYLGDELFVSKMQKQVNTHVDLSEIPKLQRREQAKPLSYYANIFPKKQAMCEAFATGAYTFKDIADHFDVHYNTVSRIIKSR